jgi:hypothetical protein
MSTPATIGHNRPPVPTLPNLLDPATVAEIIDAELDREPPTPEGGNLKSLRARDTELTDMCQRFLAAFPEIEGPDAEQKATDVLSTIAKFAGGSGRIETARAALKAPVLLAGRTIDAEFGKLGAQLIVRSLTGPVKDRRVKPFTLAEQIVAALARYKDEQDAKIRAAAVAESRRLEAQAEMARKLAARGSGLVTMDDVANAAQAAEQVRAVAEAPAAALTKSAGSNFGTASRRRVRIATFIPGQEHLVPRQYCVPSQSLIDAAKGAPDGPMPVIPGVEFRDETDLTRR